MKVFLKRNSRIFSLTVSLFTVGVVLLTIASIFLSCSKTKPADNELTKTEILWDTWGVPHIFAKNMEETFYAYGWTQMQCHGDLILKLYGEARGRASEYWGESNLQSDIYLRTMGVPQRAKEWFNSYNPTFQSYLKAFTNGMNDYATKHRDKLAENRLLVLPVTPEDILAHTQRVIHLYFTGNDPSRISKRWNPNGSNAWAIGPARSESGNAMLLANPHLIWDDFFLFFEAQLNTTGLNAYGVTLVGMPTPIIAFNDHLGWTHTVNINDGVDIYELTLEKDGYLLDGQKKEFQTHRQLIKIKNEDGTIGEKEIVIENSAFGPVIDKKKTRAIAVKVAGLDQPLIWEEWLDLCRATNLKEFETVLARLQIPMFNVVYADNAGHIMLMHNAALPKRTKGDWKFWEGIVPGDKSDMLWNGYHSYNELPRVVDPPNGWVQNANLPPWSTTYPMTLNATDFPSYMTIPPQDYEKYSNFPFRTLRSMHMLWQDKSISFQELIDYKHSTRMELADRILDDLLPALHEYGNDIAKEAATVLENWDHNTDSTSRGAILFEAWYNEMKGEIFSTKWKAGEPFTTPDGLANPNVAVKALEKAALKIKEKFGALDIPWGEVYHLTFEGKNFPANGGPGRLGIFRTMYYRTDEKGKFNAEGGDTFVAAVQFSNPIKAKAVLYYGNASQPNSTHRYDQIHLHSQKKLRPVWLTKSEILQNLEKREEF